MKTEYSEEPIWYRDGYFWRKKSEPWEIERWEFQVDSLGDIIHHTLRKIIEDNDKSNWAIDAWFECAILLFDDKRWPDRMEAYIPRTQKWRSWPIIRLMYFEGKGDYRTQTSITFDPWVLLYACAIHLGRDLMYLPKPQWWLYRPTRFSWIRKLKGKPNLYRFWKWISPTSKKQYVIDLNKFMEQALKK